MLVGLGGRIPQPGQPLQVIIAAFFSVLVDQPQDLLHRPLAVDRDEAIDDRVIVVDQQRVQKADVEVHGALIVALQRAQQGRHRLTVVAAGVIVLVERMAAVGEIHRSRRTQPGADPVDEVGRDAQPACALFHGEVEGLDPIRAQVRGVGAAVFRVRGCAVVTLVIVLNEQLPVGLHFVAFAVRNPGAVEAEGRQRAVDFGAQLIETGGIIGQRNEDQAVEHLTGHRLQPQPVLIQLRPHQPRVAQAAVEVVGPGVVGADELPCRAAVFEADARAAVPADVGEGADLPVFPAHQNHGLVEQVEQHVVARAGDFVGQPSEVPFAHHHRFHVGGEYLVGGVEGLLHRKTRPVSREQVGNRSRGGYGAMVVHGSASCGGVQSNSTTDSAPHPTRTLVPAGTMERPAVLRMEIVTASSALGRSTL